MKPVTKEMIKLYRIKKQGFDFMGYTFQNVNELSFHHLIIPKRDCHNLGYGDGYFFWNGAILKQNSSHDYLHLIERIDRDKFIAITQILIEENRLGEIGLDNLRKIRAILLSFEEQHKHDKDSKGKILIKRPYIKDRIDL